MDIAFSFYSGEVPPISDSARSWLTRSKAHSESRRLRMTFPQRAALITRIEWYRFQGTNMHIRRKDCLLLWAILWVLNSRMHSLLRIPNSLCSPYRRNTDVLKQETKYFHIPYFRTFSQHFMLWTCPDTTHQISLSGRFGDQYTSQVICDVFKRLKQLRTITTARSRSIARRLE